MEAARILMALSEEGFSVTLVDGGRLLIRPASALTDTQREMLLAFKPEIVAFLTDAHLTTIALIKAAMRRCDELNDGPAARADMERDCLTTPPHQRQDLLDYFNSIKGTT